jgi:hypothetical protein
MDSQFGILVKIISKAIEGAFFEFAHQQSYEKLYYQQPTLSANVAFRIPSDEYSIEIHGHIAHQNWDQTSVPQSIAIHSYYQDNYQSHVSASEPMVPCLQHLMPQQDNMKPYYQQLVLCFPTIQFSNKAMRNQLMYILGHQVSYGPHWAHYLGGYQDRLLGGPLGLHDLGH